MNSRCCCVPPPPLVPQIRNHIKSSLRDVGKGWFNLKESNRELYDFSKLKRFLAMVNFMMQDTLRFAVMDNLQRFTDYIVTAAEGVVTVSNTSDVAVDYSSSKVEMRHRRPPLFSVDVDIVPDTAAIPSVVSPAPSTTLDTQSVVDEEGNGAAEDDGGEKERPPPPAILAQRLCFAYNIPLDKFRCVSVANWSYRYRHESVFLAVVGV